MRPSWGTAPTPDYKGYWLVASDGGVFAFGDAGFFGLRGGQLLNSPIVGMAATADGKGYWLVSSDGGIFTYGDATFWGSRSRARSSSDCDWRFRSGATAPPGPPFLPGPPEGYCVATTNGQTYCSN